MTAVTVEQVQYVEATGLRKTPAPHPPKGARVLDGDVTLLDGSGKVVAVQSVCAPDITGPLAKLLRSIEYDVARSGRAQNEARLSGLVSAMRTFGFTPPVPLRKRYGCARCRLNAQRPDVARELDNACWRATMAFGAMAPDAYAATEAAVVRRGVPPAWRLPGGLWTSGIINANAALPYHRDAGNVGGAWSAMLGLKRSCEGGFLHLADYGVWLTIPDGSITLFDGGRTTHGVTPFRLTHPSGHRFTVVWYARAGMAVCAPNPADEPARAAAQATRYAERKAKA